MKLAQNDYHELGIFGIIISKGFLDCKDIFIEALMSFKNGDMTAILRITILIFFRTFWFVRMLFLLLPFLPPPLWCIGILRVDFEMTVSMVDGRAPIILLLLSKICSRGKDTVTVTKMFEVFSTLSFLECILRILLIIRKGLIVISKTFLLLLVKQLPCTKPWDPSNYIVLEFVTIPLGQKNKFTKRWIRQKATQKFMPRTIYCVRNYSYTSHSCKFKFRTR